MHIKKEKHMLISEKLEKAINTQIGNEFGASLEYLQIASYFESGDMLKLSQIFFDQSDERRGSGYPGG